MLSLIHHTSSASYGTKLFVFLLVATRLLSIVECTENDKDINLWPNDSMQDNACMICLKEYPTKSLAIIRHQDIHSPCRVYICRHTCTRTWNNSARNPHKFSCPLCRTPLCYCGVCHQIIIDHSAGLFHQFLPYIPPVAKNKFSWIYNIVLHNCRRPYCRKIKIFTFLEFSFLLVNILTWYRYAEIIILQQIHSDTLHPFLPFWLYMFRFMYVLRRSVKKMLLRIQDMRIYFMVTHIKVVGGFLLIQMLLFVSFITSFDSVPLSIWHILLFIIEMYVLFRYNLTFLFKLL